MEHNSKPIAANLHAHTHTHTHTYTRHVAMLSLRMADFNGHIEGDEIDRGEEGQISPSEIHDLESRILTTGL
jgi:hypothetical protein